MKKALITGVAGQDGSYLAELLISFGYEVHGLTRTPASESLVRIAHLLSASPNTRKALQLHSCDITDLPKLRYLVGEIKPDEIYNFAAQSHILTSHHNPQETEAVNARAAERLLEIVRAVSPTSRVYQASSSEMFGDSPGPHNELSPFSPQTPYGISKVHAHEACSLYRDEHGLFVSSGILFNHESPRRSELFVTRKITQAAALIHSGQANTLELGDLDASRDWGYAPDYVFAMWKMLQIDTPRDFVISTGIPKTVRAFVAEAFSFFDLDWREHTRINSAFLRPTKVSANQGDSSLASLELGWRPSVFPSQLIKLMCEAELQKLAGHAIDIPKSSLWTADTN